MLARLSTLINVLWWVCRAVDLPSLSSDAPMKLNSSGSKSFYTSCSDLFNFEVCERHDLFPEVGDALEKHCQKKAAVGATH